MNELLKIDSYLAKIAAQNDLAADALQFPDCEIDPQSIKVIMISEVVPRDPDDGFYSNKAQSDYMKSTLSLFGKANVNVRSMQEILDLGIYITTAAKTSKTGYTIATELIKTHLPILEAELALFPNLRAIMLMGDVAKKAVNLIIKAKIKKNIIPSESTYKIRNNEYYWNDIRIFPSYIITGGNILIEKSKCEMIVDDIQRMIELIGV